MSIVAFSAQPPFALAPHALFTLIKTRFIPVMRGNHAFSPQLFCEADQRSRISNIAKYEINVLITGRPAFIL
ncbi:hypothetical protein ACT5AM_000009 [Cronobacter malonaticus]